ncbi:MAG: helix-turn-helix domain-containing protein [Mangrovibacterium sp.]
MKDTTRMPRILKINWIKDLSISVVFNNGESRVIDFRKVLSRINLEENAPARILFDAVEFGKVELENNTLSWNNVEQYITMRNKEKMKVPFQIGADVLLKYSRLEKSELSLKIAGIIKSSRMAMGMSQQELALASGTTRASIARIENDKADLELGTLRRIVETGLGKKIEINIR